MSNPFPIMYSVLFSIGKDARNFISINDKVHIQKIQYLNYNSSLTAIGSLTIYLPVFSLSISW